MSRNRSWREKCAVYIVRVGGFTPTSPWTWPDEFTDATIHVRNVTLTEARTIAWSFNKAAMQRRQTDVAGWDRRWAIACLHLKYKGHDKREDVPERPSIFNRDYSPAEIDRLLSACDSAPSGRWWRDFIHLVMDTGLRTSYALKIQPWPGDKRQLYAEFKSLLQAAGIDGNHGIHGLRQVFYRRILGEKGGAA